MQDHYEVLGIAETATQAEIKAAWRQANSKAHPDREGGSHEAQARVNEAYRILSNPEERAAYDSGLEGLIADPKEARARDFLVTTFLAVITKAPEGLNLVSDTHRMLNEHRAQHQGALNELRTNLRQLTKRLNALVFKGAGPDFLRAAVEQRMSQVREAIEVNEEMVARIDGAHKILAEYAYAMEQRRASGMGMADIWAGAAEIPASRLAFKWPEGS